MLTDDHIVKRAREVGGTLTARCPTRPDPSAPPEISGNWILTPASTTACVIEPNNLHPGDLVVLTVPRDLTDRARERIRQAFEDHLAHGVKVVVLEEGIRVENILRPGRP